jgi:hypothetical protein
MTRGLAWDANELQVASKAYAIATKNNIRGADQTSKKFGQDILRLVKELQPPNLKNTVLRYGNRENGHTCILRQLKDVVFPDIQKFGKKLLSIKSRDLTGNLTERDIHCMAIAVHLRKCVGVNYNYCIGGTKAITPETDWKYYLAYLEVKHLEKFDICPQKTVSENHDKKIASLEKAAQLKKRSKNYDWDDDSDDGSIDNEDNNLPVQEDNYKYYSSDEDENDENNSNKENVVIPQNEAASVNYHAPASDKKKSVGIKKAKLDLKKSNQFDASVLAINNVGKNITKINNNVQDIKDIIKKKAKRKNDKEMIFLLQRKYDTMKVSSPFEAERIRTKINKLYDKRLEELELESNNNDDDKESE